MGTDTLPCLGRFKKHSCYPWHWVSDRNLYYRECSLLGCPFSETSHTLTPIGRAEIVGGTTKHDHTWTPWESAADQTGSYMPPWTYKRKCPVCGAEHKTEKLEK